MPASLSNSSFVFWHNNHDTYKTYNKIIIKGISKLIDRTLLALKVVILVVQLPAGLVCYWS